VKVLRKILLGLGVLLAVFLGVVLVLALWPESTSGLASHPAPVVSYQASRAAFARVEAEERDEVVPQCRSRLLTHGARADRAVVLVHGLTNCPKQFAELGDEFYERGWNVLILRLPHHGIGDPATGKMGSVDNLDGMTARELADYGDRAVDLARGLGTHVTVMGLSTGGVVTSWVGEHRGDVDRVIAIAPAIGIHGLPYTGTWLLTNLFGHLPGIALGDDAKLNHEYQGWSTKGLAETFVLGKSVRRQAARERPRVRSLVLVVNPNDDDVSNSVARGVADDWRKQGGAVLVYELPKRPDLGHDIIDPSQPWARPGFVYPRLIRLAEQAGPGA
jgi:esterase/lipase